MDIRQLQYFKEIVKQGSISKAAKELHIAQPPLSQLLQKLETELGTTLIHRYRKKWELTETGEILYHYAEQTVTQMNEVKNRIQEIEEGVAGTVRIGVASSCSNLLADYISNFRAKFPSIRLSIITGNSEELLKRLEQKEIDIALLLRPSNRDGFTMKVLQKQPPVLIIPSSWSASFLINQVKVEQIGRHPFIMLGAMEGHYFREHILKAFNDYDIKLDIIIECKDISMIVALVSRGVGLSIIPKMDYTSPLLEHIKLLELNQLHFYVEPVIVKLAEEPISKAARQFWEIVQ